MTLRSIESVGFLVNVAGPRCLKIGSEYLACLAPTIKRGQSSRGVVCRWPAESSLVNITVGQRGLPMSSDDIGSVNGPEAGLLASLTEGRPPEEGSLSYEPLQARAEVRERVRRFTDRIQCLIEQPLDGPNDRKLSSIDTVLKYRSLTEYRLYAVRMTTSLLLIVATASVMVASLERLGIVPSAMTFDGQPMAYVVMAVLAGVGGIICAVVLLSRRLDTYDNYSERQMHVIEQAISTRIIELQQAFSAAQNKFQVEVAPEQFQERASAKEAILGSFGAWRELERLPIYLRHETTEYFSAVNDARAFGKGRLGRLTSFFVAALIFVLTVCVAAASFLRSADFGVTAVTMLVTIASLFAVPIGIARSTRMPGENWFFLSVGLAIGAFVAAGTFLASGAEISDGNARFVLTILTIVTAAIFIGMIIAGEVYKRAADTLIMSLVRALKTHTKSYAEKLPRGGFRMWLKDSRGDPDTWNGWTPTYVEEQREALRAQGVSDEDIDVQIGMDEVTYVGNGENRRLQAAKTDLVSGFYERLPVTKK